MIDRWLEESTIQPLPNFYTRFVKMASAFFFEKWLESRGLDAAKLSEEQLAEAVSRAHQELQALNRGDIDLP